MKLPNPNLIRFIRPARLQRWCAEHGVLTGRWTQEDVDRIQGYVTKMGKLLTDDDIQALADEAEQGYDVNEVVQICGRCFHTAHDDVGECPACYCRSSQPRRGA